jgi:hypothetical protein
MLPCHDFLLSMDRRKQQFALSGRSMIAALGGKSPGIVLLDR